MSNYNYIAEVEFLKKEIVNTLDGWSDLNKAEYALAILQSFDEQQNLLIASINVNDGSVYGMYTFDS